MYGIAIGIYLYGWGDAGDSEELNNRKREYLGLEQGEDNVLKSPVLRMLNAVLNTKVTNSIDIKLFKDDIYNKFYNSTSWDEHLEEESLSGVLPTLSKNIFKENPLLSERIGLMDRYVELRVYEQTGIDMFDFLNLPDADMFYLLRILTRVNDSQKSTIDDLLKEQK